MNFDLNKLSGDDAKALVKSLATGFQATIQNQQVSSEKLISTLVLDLSIARTRTNALKVSFPFVSLRVEEASDTLANCRVIPITIDNYQDDTLLKLNDSLEFDNGISSLYITNLAQSGKSMIIKFYTTARVRSGSLVLANNSVVNNLTIGGSTLLNDGLSIMLATYINSMPATGTRIINLSDFTGMNDSSYNNAGYTITGSGSIFSSFKVPVGFTFEITGFQYKTSIAFNSTSFSCSLMAFINNETFVNMSNASFVSREVGGFTFFGGVPISANPITGYIDATLVTNGILPDRKKVLFYENETPAMVIDNQAVGVTGSMQLIFIGRLTKNVGA